MEKPVIVIGATSLGRAAVEIFKQHDVMVYCYLDEEESLHNTEIDDIIVMGSIEDDEFLNLIGKKCGAFVAVEHSSTREKVIEILEKERKAIPVNAIHPTAIIAESVKIGDGNLINSLTSINPGTQIANNCMINSNVVIEQEVLFGDNVQVGAGSIINSKANIGEGVIIGSGAIIGPNIKLGKNVQVGPGSVVLQDVEEGKTVFGMPAQVVG